MQAETSNPHTLGRLDYTAALAAATEIRDAREDIPNEKNQQPEGRP